MVLGVTAFASAIADFVSQRIAFSSSRMNWNAPTKANTKHDKGRARLLSLNSFAMFQVGDVAGQEFRSPEMLALAPIGEGALHRS